MAVAGVEEINSSACLEREVGRKQSREKQISGGGRGNNELSFVPPQGFYLRSQMDRLLDLGLNDLRV